MTATPAPQNLVIVLSDEHNRKIAGCYGHGLAQTPNIDRLAAGGTRFANAYCNSPICVPARAALATGRYAHDIQCWDNAFPYTGSPASWHHALRDRDHDVVAIGKLHFRRSGDDNGFSREILPMHVLDGHGDLKGLMRRDPPVKQGAERIAEDAGVGVSDYVKYDRGITQAAAKWLRDAAVAPPAKPWVLMVSFVLPHFPLVAPREYFDLYGDCSLDALRAGLDAAPSGHPAVAHLRAHLNYDSFFTDERRRVALQAYFGMVSHLDACIGDVLGALDTNGLTGSTRVIYTSDHGDNLGNRGLWGKSVMFEDAVGVPMIMAGDGVPANHVAETPVSLVDVFPTVLQGAGVDASDGVERPGRSLFEVIANPTPERTVFSEYHAVGSPTAFLMVRRGPWKYIAYPGYPPQLFNLAEDPDEVVDRAGDAACDGVRRELDAALRDIVDPDAVNALAFADQERRIAAHGGREQVLQGVDIPHTPAPLSAA